MKLESVKENVNFKRAYHQGKSKVFKEIVVYWRKNPFGKTRLGLTVSKKLGNSPKRNRVRRILRAAAAAQREILPQGCDIIIVARAKCLTMKSPQIEQLLKETFSV